MTIVACRVELSDGGLDDRIAATAVVRISRLSR
jgi:hypothetical protein